MSQYTMDYFLGGILLTGMGIREQDTGQNTGGTSRVGVTGRSPLHFAISLLESVHLSDAITQKVISSSFR